MESGLHFNMANIKSSFLLDSDIAEELSQQIDKNISTWSCWPVDASQIRTNLSYEPEIIRVPSAENETELTLPVSCMVSNGICSIAPAMDGMAGNDVFHFRHSFVFLDQVANTEMYKWGVDAAAGLPAKYVAKFAASPVSLSNSA